MERLSRQRLFRGVLGCGVVGVFLWLVFNTLATRPAATTASALDALQSASVLLREGTTKPELSARSSLSIFVGTRSEEQILFEKNADERVSIASITKLLVALVASDFASTTRITLSEKALQERGVSGVYTKGDTLLLFDALHALLIASHNEVAYAIAEQTGIERFLIEMNAAAQQIGLANTALYNVTGLDPIDGGDKINHSTARDVYRLARFIQEEHPELLRMSAQQVYDLSTAGGQRIATLTNTNLLLNGQTIPFPIIGSKTGETPRAKQNLLIVAESPCGGKLYNVVLGSVDRVVDMQKLLGYANDSYTWVCVGAGKRAF